jgi:hypothetical protein
LDSETGISFNVFERSSPLGEVCSATIYSFNKRGGRLIGKITGPPGTDLWQVASSKVTKIKVPKIGAAHEYDVYSPGEAIKEAAKPDSRLVFEPRPS